MEQERRLKGRMCWTCYNFEDRRCIEGALLCGRRHFLKDGCDDFVDRTRKLKEIGDINRYERAMIRAILMESKISTKYLLHERHVFSTIIHGH